MAAFLDLLRVRLAPDDRPYGLAGGEIRGPAPGEPFGRRPNLRVQWSCDASGSLAACWKRTRRRTRLTAPS